MKSFFRIAFSLSLSLLVQSCKSKTPTRTMEAEVIWRLQHDKSQPDHVREGAGIMLDVLNENRHISFRDYFDAERKVSSERSPATVRAWIALLHSTENRLSDPLPSAEQIDREKRDSIERKSKFIHYTNVSRLSLFGSCIAALTSFDMPEADLEVEGAIRRFESKYGNTSGGEKMLEKYRTEISQQKEMIRLRTTPWQLGPSSSHGGE